MIPAKKILKFIEDSGGFTNANEVSSYFDISLNDARQRLFLLQKNRFLSRKANTEAVNNPYRYFLNEKGKKKLEWLTKKKPIDFPEIESTTEKEKESYKEEAIAEI